VKVRLETTFGDLVLELDETRAPETTANFLAYLADGFYDGTLFHRVIDGFMIQGGGLLPGLHRKPTRPPIRNEAANGLRNLRGTVAMARTSEPHSATSQFFINVADNPFLDFRAESAEGWGYCVFGQVVEGMDVVDRIRAVPTGARGGQRDVPVEDVLINRATAIPG
jgi:peptidyl-prolyl cis-trans isomerase B (cyclophilin B)